MCDPVSIGAFFSAMAAPAASTTAAVAAPVTAGTTASLAAVPVAATKAAVDTVGIAAANAAGKTALDATLTNLVTGTAAPTVGKVATGITAGGLAKSALTAASLASPLLSKVKAPAMPGQPQLASPESAALKARLAARMRARGAYGQAGTALTRGNTAATTPTSGGKALLGS